MLVGLLQCFSLCSAENGRFFTLIKIIVLPVCKGLSISKHIDTLKILQVQAEKEFHLM